MRTTRAFLVLILCAAVVAAVAGCRPSNPPVRNGFAVLSVASTPSGARIFLNGGDKGVQTPHRFEELIPGVYEVKLSLEGYWDETRSAPCPEGKETKVDIVLRLKPEPTAAYNGAAPVRNNDEKSARTAAINNALMAEIEKRFGPHAAEKERLSNFDLYRGYLLDDPRILKYEVRAENPEGDMYFVKVEVTFTADAARVKSLHELKLLVNITENYLDKNGKTANSTFFTNKLQQWLIGQSLGLTIVTGGIRADQADVVLTGNAAASEHSRQGNECTYRADVSLRLSRRLSREPVTMPDAHIAGKPRFTDADAVRSAMDAAAEAVFKQLSSALIALNEVIVERIIYLTDVSDRSEADSIIRAIRKIDGVTEVNELSFNESKETLSLLVRMKIEGQKDFNYYLDRLRFGSDVDIDSSEGGVIRGHH